MPSRFSHYDTDEERLPDGMTRVGYDADTQVYTFQDSDGSYWEGAPGCEYGQLTRVGDGAPDDADDTEPFLASNDSHPGTSWRHELMPLLNFGLIIGLCLLLLFWFLPRGAAPDKKPLAECTEGSSPYTIQSGDTCWSIGEDNGLSVDDILRHNPSVDCDKLAVGAEICLPT